MAKPAADQNRWRARPVLAGSITAAALAVPIGCSIAVAVIAEHVVTKPATVAGLVAWWIGIMVSSTVAFLAAERLTRRALPLAALLRMSLLFPGRAPRRLALARRTGTTRDLQRRLEAARSVGLADEPTLAAERIVALAASLSVHDRSTRGHAERVRAYTDVIAGELHLHEDDRDRLRWSALLHDIGKLAVHPDTLNKPGRLTEDEWEVIRQHPLEGAKITAPLAEWLGEWANTIAEHHERYDGGGYPYGRKGREISLGGRIVAVADSYDVMTSSRPYKKAMAPAAARAELTACARTQFDPDIVRAFLQVSVTRLRGVAPFAWLGSMPFVNVLPQLAGAGALGARAVVGGVVVAGSVATGLTAAAPVHPARNAPLRAAAVARFQVETPVVSTTRPDASPRSMPSVIATRAVRPTTTAPAVPPTPEPTATTRLAAPATTVHHNAPPPPATSAPPNQPAPPAASPPSSTTTTSVWSAAPATTVPPPAPSTTTTTRPPPTTTTTTRPPLCILIICL